MNVPCPYIDIRQEVMKQVQYSMEGCLFWQIEETAHTGFTYIWLLYMVDKQWWDVQESIFYVHVVKLDKIGGEWDKDIGSDTHNAFKFHISLQMGNIWE